MWHEARKHERKLRGMMVDYKKRAERRREYYEKIKKDPAQFLQVHGRACKIHLDSAVALAAESPVNMMPWQGDTNNMIDRFDVRAHLDHIPSYSPALLNPISPEQESDERKCNYERYRGLVQNDFAGISEEQCLYQIYMDELYGGLPKPNEEEKKKLAEKKASIGYTYEDSTVAELENSAEKAREEEDSEEENSNTDEDEVIPDIDVEVDVDELNQEQVADLNKQATTYGMAEGDFVRMLRKDKEEAEAIKNAKALEEEKAMYSGRRSRRQRREFREKRLKGRKISPPRGWDPASSPFPAPGAGIQHPSLLQPIPDPRSWGPPCSVPREFRSSAATPAATAPPTTPTNAPPRNPARDRAPGPGRHRRAARRRSPSSPASAAATRRPRPRRPAAFPGKGPLPAEPARRRGSRRQAMAPRPGRCRFPSPPYPDPGGEWGGGGAEPPAPHPWDERRPPGSIPTAGSRPRPGSSRASVAGAAPRPPPRPRPRPPRPAPARAPARAAGGARTAPAAPATATGAAIPAPAPAPAAIPEGGPGTGAAAPGPTPRSGAIATAAGAGPGAARGPGSAPGAGAIGAAAGAAGAAATPAAPADPSLRSGTRLRAPQHRPPWGRS
ncbi:CLK4-associating serine/arginine rich protein isoform X5 [Lathamus discolor]|uniref:CLK4-associating serine/arginine rich protein isoform X5 n=1 Tax=Lathamus discolor TaxID=678569 RepID=UPI0032B7CABB